MYKNFNITEEERKEILDKHKKHGYKQPLNESEPKIIKLNLINEQTVVNVNPKNLKFGDRGDDVKKLQQLLMDKGYLKTDTMVPTGFFGKLTNGALKSFLSGGVPLTATPSFSQGQGVKKPAPVTQTKQQPQTKVTKPQEKPVSSSGDYALIFAFPYYEPKVSPGEKGPSDVQKIAIRLATGYEVKPGTWGKVGHAGISLISKDGNVKLYEFGRYNGSPVGKGKVIKTNIGKIANMDKNNKLINASQVAGIIKSKTQGEGPTQNMTYAIVSIPNIIKAITSAEGGGAYRDYMALDVSAGGAQNCGTFAMDVARDGGVPISDFCTPAPINMIQKFKSYSITGDLSYA